MRTCRICGKQFEGTHWMKPYEDICSKTCFDKNFWLEIIAELERDKYSHPIIDGHCYFVGQENDRGAFRGYGGALFYITFNDGHMIYSTNLWSNGQVDPDFTKQLPNNAHMSTKEEIAKNPRIRAVWAAKKIASQPYDKVRQGFRHPTIREVAEELGVSKSVIGVDLKKRLPEIDHKLYVQTQAYLSAAYENKHIEGGKATARRYKK